MVAESVPVAPSTSWEFDDEEPIADGLTAIGLLGGGDRTEAWLAWDGRLRTPVVAKLIRPHLVADAHVRESLAREAALLARLQHPAIVRIYSARVDGPRPYLVLEALDGPRLSTLLRRFGPLAPEQVVPLALNVASALAFMHDEGYVHLDVKPRNLIMGASPRVIDLGIARSFEELSVLTSPVGTVAYMAPEQSKVELLDRIGPWTDVWGLCVTMYESVSGRLPFPKRPDGSHSQNAGPITLLDDRVPEPIRDIIHAGLVTETAVRPRLPDIIDELERLYPEARATARRRIRRRYR
jgi:serine/threonine-protein kinase